MKWLATLLIFFITPYSWAQENANPFDVQVNVTNIENRFQIQVSYAVPTNLCTAYAFITDYEDTKNIPGVIEAKVISRSSNRVRVYRVIEEQILFFPIEMRSTVEYTELPNQLLFEQISGDVRRYKGAWKLAADKNKVIFSYDAEVQPQSLIPSVVIEYFLKSSIRGRFESMAERASQYKPINKVACR